MEIEQLKRLIDTCYLGKRCWELLPKLPDGVLPSYIHYLDVVQQMEAEGRQVRVSDISDALNLPRPGVTRTVKGMVEKGYLAKRTSAEDGRVTHLSITEEGRVLFQKYNEAYFGALARQMDNVSEADAECTVRTMEKLYQTMCKGGDRFENR